MAVSGILKSGFPNPTTIAGDRERGPRPASKSLAGSVFIKPQPLFAALASQRARAAIADLSAKEPDPTKHGQGHPCTPAGRIASLWKGSSSGRGVHWAEAW